MNKTKNIFYLMLLVSQTFSVSLLSAQDNDRHDAMLCNCYEIHRAHAKDIWDTSEYKHDHGDGWNYYHFLSFDYQPWKKEIAYIDGDGVERMYPRIIPFREEEREGIPNGTCDVVVHTVETVTSISENINEQFSGSKLSRVEWTQLDENRITTQGTSKIGYESSAGGNVGVADVELKGSQEFSLTAGYEAHRSLSLTNVFEASNVVTNSTGETKGDATKKTTTWKIQPCHILFLTKIKTGKRFKQPYVRKAHNNYCKYEGTFYDTWGPGSSGHKTVCPQGDCKLIVTAYRLKTISNGGYTAFIDVGAHAEYLTEGFKCDNCCTENADGIVDCEEISLD